ncbi:hypothetical protein [Marinomonas sp. FW-1]|nr:hypothetical protein [Marinomonas sp. FW-1]
MNNVQNYTMTALLDKSHYQTAVLPYLSTDNVDEFSHIAPNPMR